MSSPSISSHTDATPILSPLFSNAADVPRPINYDQLQHELDDFIKNQKLIHNTSKLLSIHQLTHSASTSESSITSLHITPTRAQRFLMKCKYPNNPTRILTNGSSSSKLLRHHYPPHTKTSTFQVENLPVVPQNTFNNLENQAQ